MLQKWFDNLRDLADLKAQLDMAASASTMTCLTVVSCVIAAVGLYGLWRSLAHTRKAIETNMVTANDARILGEANARAYLHAESMRLSDDGDAVIINIKNTGATPAPMLSVGWEVKSVPPGRMKDAMIWGSLGYKGWHSLSAGTDRDYRLEFTQGAEIIAENRRRLMGTFGLVPSATENTNRVVIVGRIVWNDVFGHYMEAGFAFYTEDIVRNKFKVPAAILPAFRFLEKQDIPRGMQPVGG